MVIPALEGLANVNRRKGESKLALEEYDQAEQVALKLGDKLRQSELAWCQAGFHYELGNFEKSEELSGIAGRLADEIHEANYSYLALTQSGKSLLALGRYDAAREKLESAIEKVEQIRSWIGGQEQQRAYFFERKVEPYYLMADLLLKEKKPERAVEFAERARSRTMLDLSGSGRLELSKVISPAEKEEEQRLDAHLIEINTLLYKEHQRENPDLHLIQELKARVDKARVDNDSFLDRLYVSHPEAKIDYGQTSPFALKDAAIVLPSRDAAIVEFEVLDDKMYVFMLALGDKGNIEVTSTPVSISRKDLAAKVRGYRDRITNYVPEFQRESSAMYQLVLGPVASALKGKKMLIVVPDDVLWEVPFQALQDKAGRYLIEDHSVFYAPSLTVLREMKRKDSIAPASAAPTNSVALGSTPTFLAFGDPALSSKTVARLRSVERNERLGPLPESREEVETLGKLYGRSRSEVFVGADATEERAKSEMTRFRILHFATHGILDGINPLYSNLVLSQSASDPGEDGLLEAREIMEMRLKADIAVLSACQTGGGRVSRGEGVIGMSWALFMAGCPTTVVSQWDVETTSTAKLMVEFHKALLATNRNSEHIRGSAEALRQAALKVLKTPGYSHPFYWAAFIVIGAGW